MPVSDDPIREIELDPHEWRLKSGASHRIPWQDPLGFNSYKMFDPTLAPPGTLVHEAHVGLERATGPTYVSILVLVFIGLAIIAPTVHSWAVIIVNAVWP